MANYYTPTAVQQPIPATDLTSLERLLLANIFDMQIDDDALYFSSDEGASDMLYLDAEQLRPCLDDPAVEGSSFDVVLANILAIPLKLLAPLLAAHVAEGGWLVLAGILERQAADLRAAYAPHLALDTLDAEDGWVLMGGRRAAAGSVADEAAGGAA